MPRTVAIDRPGEPSSGTALIWNSSSVSGLSTAAVVGSRHPRSRARSGVSPAQGIRTARVRLMLPSSLLRTRLTRITSLAPSATTATNRVPSRDTSKARTLRPWIPGARTATGAPPSTTTETSAPSERRSTSQRRPARSQSGGSRSVARCAAVETRASGVLTEVT